MVGPWRPGRQAGASGLPPPLLLLALAVVAAPAPTAGFAPPELVWASGGTATVSGISVPVKTATVQYGPATVTIPGGGGTLKTLLHAGSLPSPTLRLQRCTQYQLTLANAAAVPTNVHTHGLAVSGDAPGDDVKTMVAAGASYTYVWNVPCNHAGGTFWWHPHHHATVRAQLGGGALGAVIVDDSAGEGWPTTGGWAGMASREHTLVLHAFDAADASGNAWFDASGMPVTKLYLANGAVKPSLALGAAHTWHRVRVVHASASATGTLFTLPAACSTALIARDGVLLPSVGRALAAGTFFHGTMASRADVAVSCPQGEHAIVTGGVTVATLSVGAPPAGVAAPPALAPWAPCRPGYLADLSAATPTEAYTVTMSGSQINGQSWDPSVVSATFTSGAVQEWSLKGTGAHPFHLHVAHFQLQTAAPSGPAGWYATGDWWDTLSASGTAVVRFRTPHACKVAMHCHILAHEDGGAMGQVAFVGGVPGTGIVTTSTFTCPAAAAVSPSPPPPAASPSPPPPASSPSPPPPAGTCAQKGASCAAVSCCSNWTCRNGVCK